MNRVIKFPEKGKDPPTLDELLEQQGKSLDQSAKLLNVAFCILCSALAIELVVLALSLHKLVR